MLVLVLDTSTPAVTAALVDIAEESPSAPSAGPMPGGPVTAAADSGVVVLAERFVVDGRAHGELLAPQVAAVLAEAAARPRDLTAIVAGLGPGPYTGLRVGLVTAASMGQVLGIPGYGVCSLDALGLAAGPGCVLAATDARRREVYWATYRDGARVAGPDVARPADLFGSDGVGPGGAGPGGARPGGAGPDGAGPGGAGPGGAGRGGAGPGDVVGAVDRAVGEGAQKYAEVLGLPIDDDLLHPPAWALAVLAADRVRAGAPAEILTPLYLRRPDAMEPAARKPALR